MADPFTTLVHNLNAMGFYTFLLPWLFVFAVVYGLLSTVKLFGEQNNRISALIAFIAAFFAVSFAGPMMAAFFTNLFGGATIILAGILVIVLLLAMAGFKLDALTDINKMSVKIVILLLIIIGIIVFLAATGNISGVVLNDDLITMIFIIVVILFAIWFVTGGEKKGSATTGQKPTG
ncbi:MAG: hypothetical protein V1900_00030 [Candidatus Aenigmatarchaeota archaeon]